MVGSVRAPGPLGRARIVARSPQARCVRARAASVAKPESSVAVNEGDVYDVVVVGGGIAGLMTGLALQTKHSDSVGSFLVTEARERVGGNITSCSDDKYIWEEGPNSCQPSDAVLEAAVRSTSVANVFPAVLPPQMRRNCNLSIIAALVCAGLVRDGSCAWSSRPRASWREITRPG